MTTTRDNLTLISHFIHINMIGFMARVTQQRSQV